LILSIFNMVLGLVLAPLLIGVVARTKAVFAGRKGPALLQQYFDIIKYLRKGAVFSSATSWVFRAGPTVGLACSIIALALMPFGGIPGTLSFGGDMLLLIYLFGLARFFTVIAALDTASSFEGMGASREVLFSALAEPAMLICLIALARAAGSLLLFDLVPGAVWKVPELLLVAIILCVILLCENARIPFDDPATHLELTMIHEVMVLDHSGPDFAFILYASALKLWVYSSLIIGMLTPFSAMPWWMGLLVETAGTLVLAAGVGVVESIMARVRLVWVPKLLTAAGAGALIALILVIR
jgi:formate hydrogenlyase subunit 4